MIKSWRPGKKRMVKFAAVYISPIQSGSPSVVGSYLIMAQFSYIFDLNTWKVMYHFIGFSLY